MLRSNSTYATQFKSAAFVAAQRPVLIDSEPGDPDAWHCSCGNTPSDSGFHPINENLQEVEPTPEEWTTDCYYCAQCGSIVTGDGVVVGSAPLQTISRLYT